jgi:hypothetical protein
MPARLVSPPAGGEIAQAQARDRLDESCVGEVRFDRQRFLRTHQRFVRPVEPAQGRRAVGKKRRVVRRKLKHPFIGRDGLFHPVEPQQRIAAVAKRVGVLRTRCQHAIEAFERLARSPQLEQRHAAPIEKLGIVRLKPEALLVACERTRKIPQRMEDRSEAGKALGTERSHFRAS